jgi:hypothetical protein
VLRSIVIAGIALLLLKLLVREWLPSAGYVIDVLFTICLLGGAAALVVEGQRRR